MFGGLVNNYHIIVATTIGINLILVQSFNFAFGLGFLFNLAHIAFYAIGAYTTALLATQLELNFWWCTAASMLLGGLSAFIVGGIALRLSSDYFAIGTLALHSVITALLINWKSLTRGVLGIPGIPRPEIGTTDFNNEANFLALVYIMVAICFCALWMLFKSPFGRALRSQAERTEFAEAIGKNTVRLKTTCLVISAIGAALAGSAFAYYIRYIDPSSFALNEMVFVFTVVVVGRPGSFWGAAAATIFLVLLPEALRFTNLPSSILGPMRQLLYAIILFAAVSWNRKVLFPAVRKI